MRWEDVENNVDIVGKRYWICDYRLNSEADFRPIRGIKPTYIEIRSNEELPESKRVYYSDFHFKEVNSKGVTTSKIIAPYDNTGYRSYKGVSLNLFETEVECREHFKQQINKCVDTFEKTINDIRHHINTLKSMIE